MCVYCIFDIIYVYSLSCVLNEMGGDTYNFVYQIWRRPGHAFHHLWLEPWWLFVVCWATLFFILYIQPSTENATLLYSLKCLADYCSQNFLRNLHRFVSSAVTYTLCKHTNTHIHQKMTSPKNLHPLVLCVCRSVVVSDEMQNDLHRNKIREEKIFLIFGCYLRIAKYNQRQQKKALLLVF